MKIKVQEQEQYIYLVEKTEIISYIESLNIKAIHNLSPSGTLVLGADHSVESVIQCIESSDRVAILIGPAFRNNLENALAVISNNKLEMFDIGEVTEDQLIISEGELA